MALHINVNGETVVCNSRQGGVWGAEVSQGGFPFKHNELLKVREGEEGREGEGENGGRG